MPRLMQEEVSSPSPPRVVAKRKLTPILKQAKIVLERVTKKKTSPPKAALPAHLRRDYDVDLDASPAGPSTSQRQRRLAPVLRDPWHVALPPRGPTPPARPPWGASSFLKKIEEEEKRRDAD